MQFLSQHGPLLLIWIAVLAFLFWMTWRPHRKRVAEHQKLMESLQRGDRIVSAGGIYGTIVGLQDKTVTLEIDKGVQVRLDRRAVRRRLGDKEDE
jgi:preprotein translocase subunit YajC